MYVRRGRARTCAAIAAAAMLLGGFAASLAGTNQDCVNNGVQGSPFPAGNGQVTVTGGQVSGAGATLFVDFFRAPSSTNDWNDVDGDGLAGNFATFPFVDNLGTLWPVNGTINTHWMFQYRSVGSVNGFNEFVESQTCNAIPLSVPAEAGIFNQFEYATLGALNWAGPFANSSGTPVQPCEIEFAFLDVPSAWAIQVQGSGLCMPGGTTSCVTDVDCQANEKCIGAPKWNAEPGSAGYGLNPIVSSTGYVSQLQPLSRGCGSCATGGDPCTDQKHCAPGICVTNGRCNASNTLCGVNADCPVGETCNGEVNTATSCRGDLNCSAGTCSMTANSCRTDDQCPVGETCSNPPPRTCENLEACTLSGNVESLNVNTVAPDADTIFDYVGAWVPIAFIANRGSGAKDVKYSDLQYLFTTGRMSNGENFVVATRSVGSGTRNGIMNSVGIDTSWGRGDNVGNENATTRTFNIGPNTQPTNAQGSGQVEQAVESQRLAIGYTGLAGPSRAASDALGGRYEVLNVCKDVDSDGNPHCDCSPQACGEGPKFCSINTTIACTTNAECNPTATNGTCVAIDAARPNNGYVRPTLSTVLDNCNACCGYSIGGNGSFVVRGNRYANRDPMDPKFIPGIPLDHQAVADYLNNIDDSTSSFEGNVFGKECNTTRTCSITASVDCNEDSDCLPSAGVCTGPFKTCTTDSACTQKSCSITGASCNVNADCPAQPQICIGGPGGNCSINAAACDMDADCNPVAQTCRADFCKSSLNMPGQFLATTFFLPPGLDCQQGLTDGMEFTPTAELNQTLQNFIRSNNGLGIGSDTPGFGSINPTDGGRMPIRNALTGGARYTDASTGASYTYWNGTSFITNFSSGRLAARNKLVGDFNNDGARNINDIAESVKAYYLPRTWQRTDPQATGVGSAGNQTNGGSLDGAIPELIGDYNSDGNLTKEDLRYLMDGLAIATSGPNTGKLDRKAGAIAIDNALATYGRCSGDNQVVCRIGVPSDCTDHGTTGPCNVAGTYPWADSANQIEIATSAGLDPKFALPKDVNDAVAPFLATGKVYVAGDFRGDVSGHTPVAGAEPVGWDGFVDGIDIDYCCRMAQVGAWNVLNDAVYLDLSCDMNGDLNINDGDVTELVEAILGTQSGDVNLDGVVDDADAAIISDSVAGNPCNADGSCGWADGDTNCDGFVNSTDLGGFLPPALLLDGTNVQKTRFISVVAPATSAQTAGTNAETALRIKLVSLHHVVPPYTGQTTVAYSAFEGQSVWAGPPQVYIESSASGVRFVAAMTSCTPHYRDWSQFRSCTNAVQICNTDADCPGAVAGTCSTVVNNTIHITGSAMVPSSTYQVENVAAACQGAEAGCSLVSSPLEIKTTRWADVETPYSPSPGQPDFGDVGAMLNKFRGALGASIKARVIIQSNDTFGNITGPALAAEFGFSHIAACVDGFRGQAYPAKMGRCSGAGTAACTTAAECTSGGNVGPCNLNCQ